MSDNSYQKYLKYKNKYLRLKAEMESKGGMLENLQALGSSAVSAVGDLVQEHPLTSVVVGGLAGVSGFLYNQQTQRISELEQEIADLKNSGSKKDNEIEDLKKELENLKKAPTPKLTSAQLKQIQDTVKDQVTEITKVLEVNFDIKFRDVKLNNKQAYFIDLITELMKDNNEKKFNILLDETEFTIMPGSSEKGIDKSMEVKLILGFFKRIILDLKDNRIDYSELKNITESAEGILDMVKVMKPGDNVKQIKEQNEKMKFAINRLVNHLQTYTNKPRGGILFPTNFYQY